MSSPSVSVPKCPEKIEGGMLRAPGVDFSPEAAKIRKMFKVNEGLCCAFAMDYAKSCLKSRTFNPLMAYAHEARIEKIGQAQGLQKEGGMEAVAKRYGLEMVHLANFGFDGFGRSYKLNFKFKPGFVHYISLAFRVNGGGFQQHGHGFAINCCGAQPWLADSSSGIYLCQGMTPEQVFVAHLCPLIEEFEKGDVRTFEMAEIYMLKLAAPDKDFRPQSIKK